MKKTLAFLLATILASCQSPTPQPQEQTNQRTKYQTMLEASRIWNLNNKGRHRTIIDLHSQGYFGPRYLEKLITAYRENLAPEVYLSDICADFDTDKDRILSPDESFKLAQLVYNNILEKEEPVPSPSPHHFD